MYVCIWNVVILSASFICKSYDLDSRLIWECTSNWISLEGVISEQADKFTRRRLHYITNGHKHFLWSWMRNWERNIRRKWNLCKTPATSYNSSCCLVELFLMNNFPFNVLFIVSQNMSNLLRVKDVTCSLFSVSSSFVF